jgi:hypothetical protein
MKANGSQWLLRRVRAARAVVAGALMAACTSGSEPAPTTGTIQVEVSTAGTVPSGARYELYVDQAPVRAVGAQERVVLEGITAGAHEVALQNLPAACAVSGAPSSTVSVPAGDAVALTFLVNCASGTLRVVTHTSGEALDSNGYTLQIPYVGSQPIALEDTLVIPDLPAGHESVTLDDVAGNCAVVGGRFRSFTLVSGAEARVEFNVSCLDFSAGAGTIQVVISTQVINAPTGLTFEVVLDGGHRVSAPVSGMVTFQNVPAGPHAVFLQVPSYCSVGGFTSQPNPILFNLAAGEVQRVRFSVLCIG